MGGWGKTNWREIQLQLPLRKFLVLECRLQRQEAEKAKIADLFMADT